jgi:hypothetical protein
MVEEGGQASKSSCVATRASSICPLGSTHGVDAASATEDLCTFHHVVGERPGVVASCYEADLGEVANPVGDLLDINPGFGGWALVPTMTRNESPAFQRLRCVPGLAEPGYAILASQLSVEV